MQSSAKVNYVVINEESQSMASREILTRPAEAFRFPLSDSDLASIRALERAFDIEEKIAGLAAPQIGIAKQAIVFKAPLEMQKWRSDFTHVVPKTIWLNPNYEALGIEQREDYEGCFSVAKLAGKVTRFYKIRYNAFLIDGSQVEGVAEGYLARIIQHEVDHLRGVLFIDKIPAEHLLSIEEYCRLRDAKMAAVD